MKLFSCIQNFSRTLYLSDSRTNVRINLLKLFYARLNLSFKIPQNGHKVKVYWLFGGLPNVGLVTSEHVWTLLYDEIFLKSTNFKHYIS